MDQKEKGLEYLNHFIRNNVVNIQGCFRQIETHLKKMNDALQGYSTSVGGEDRDENA